MRRPPCGFAPTRLQEPFSAFVAPSFNGRTADSGSAYRGSNPWGAAIIIVLKYLVTSAKIHSFSS